MSETLLAKIEPQPEHDAAIAPYTPPPPPSLFGTADPVEVVAKASRVAAALKEVVKSQGLISKISGKEYPRCEAWTLLGTMLGVFPVLVWSRPVEHGWEARVEARTRDGAIVGAAEAQCLRSERNWSNRDDFALRSMAQTRATAKALRMPLGFVMTLGGFQPTPAEEMDFDNHEPMAPKQPTTRQPDKPKDKQASKPAAEATEDQKARWIATLKPLGQAALEYARQQGWIMPPSDADDPGEPLEAMSITWVPTTKAQADRILREIQAQMDGAELGPQTPQKPRRTAAAPHQSNDPQKQSWYGFIVPIPHKGEKRDEYLKHPDTLGSLYEARHDDEEARRRMFGFIAHYEPKGWQKRDGTEMPASESDKRFRIELDRLAEFMETHHSEEMDERD